MIDRARSRLGPSAVGMAAGFTTAGAVVSLFLLGLLMVPLVGSVLRAQRGFVTTREWARTTGNARYAHLALTRLMRIAGSHPVGGPVAGVEPDPLGDGEFNDIRLRADYNPADGDTDDSGEDVTFFLRGDTMFVRWGRDAEEQPYLLGVDSLAFEYFDRDGEPISDPDRVTARAYAARITIRTHGRVYGSPVERNLTGRVRLRNGR